MKNRADGRDRHPSPRVGVGLAGLLLATGLLGGLTLAAVADTRADREAANTQAEQKKDPSQESAHQKDEKQPARPSADGQKKDSRRPDAREPSAPVAGADSAVAARADAADEPLRFTNADLPTIPRMYQGVGKAADGAAQPGKIGRRPQRKPSSDRARAVSTPPPRETTAQRRQQLRRHIAVLQERVQHLKARRLSVQNPLHRGVTPAREAEEEAVGGLAGGTQLAWVKKQLISTELELKKAQAALAAL